MMCHALFIAGPVGGSAAMHGRDEGLSPCPVVVAMMHVGDSVASRSRERQSVKRLESQSPSAIVRKCENAPSSIDIDSLSNGDEKTRTRRIKGMQRIFRFPYCAADLLRHFNL